MQHAPKVSEQGPARIPAAESVARTVGGLGNLDRSLQGDRLRELASLARDGPAAVAQRKQLKALFGATAHSKGVGDNVIQRIELDPGDSYGIIIEPSAERHGYSVGMLRAIVRHRLADIEIGDAKVMELGHGTEEGARAGRLVYNCVVERNPTGSNYYRINVFHAHGAQTEPWNPQGY